MAMQKMDKTTQSKTYLALGDSYTIGEQVALHESFPYQLVQLFRKEKISFSAAEIIAKTGWTTGELISHLEEIDLQPVYDFVSLLIGVNNQYRGQDIKTFQKEFETLLQKAIHFAAGNSDHVFVLSIPDWGVTPFASGRNRAQIAKEIDTFNFICEKQATQSGVHFINITSAQRINSSLVAGLATDGLHPSATEYELWAKKIFQLAVPLLKKDF